MIAASEPNASGSSETRPWHQLSANEVLVLFRSAAEGLSASDAAQRLAVEGPNALTEAPGPSPLQIFTGQFKSLIVWILIVAGVVSAMLGQGVDSFAILAIVVLNAGIGFYQESKAEKSIAALKKMITPQAKVTRDGQVNAIPSADVVPGDILVLEAGDIVAADARLLSSASLKCTEATLTGESQAVKKKPDLLKEGDTPLGDRANMVFMGTSVATGTGRAVVVATAMKTELGRIAGLISEVAGEDATPLQRKLEVFGRILVWAALGIVAILFGLGLMRGTPPLELFMASVGLAVAAVPEGLPAVVTVALSAGVMRMARRRALVRKLAAVETLGSTSVICTDKTGTLTVGQMTARALYISEEIYGITGEGYDPDGEVRIDGKKAEASHLAPLQELTSILLGCNQAHLVEEDGAWKIVGDPTEGALLVAGTKAGGNRKRIEDEMPKVHEFPFDSDRKRSSVIRRMPGEKLRVFVNGAPGPLLERCTQVYAKEGIRPLTDSDRKLILGQTSAMAQKALRVLASARRDLNNNEHADVVVDAIERDLVFVGLTGIYDPPRPTAKDAIGKCRAAGIRVVMITGDHPETAAAIAAEIGVSASDEVAISGTDLDKTSEEEFRTRVSKITVYARVTAEHKLRIVRALRAGGEVVAMTGDGVNDAPAIKGADIGIAMGTAGTEVTKQAADVILTDDNFATIVAAIEEGRGIYANIRKTLQYLLAGNTGELLLMTACVVIGLPAPLLAIHLLWINLVTDGLPALCLATDSIDMDLMKQSPRPPVERIADARFLSMMGFTGLLTAGVAFGVYFYVLSYGTTQAARTYAFAVLVYAELFRSFGARSETKPVWRISLLTNMNLVAVVAVSFGFQIWSQQSAALGGFLKTTALPFSDSLLLVLFGAIPLVVLELVKVGRRIVQVGKGRGCPSRR